MCHVFIIRDAFTSASFRLHFLFILAYFIYFYLLFDALFVCFTLIRLNKVRNQVERLQDNEHETNMKLTNILFALATFRGFVLGSSVEAENANELKDMLRGKLAGFAKDDCAWTPCPTDDYEKIVSAMKCTNKNLDVITPTSIDDCQQPSQNAHHRPLDGPVVRVIWEGLT